MLECKYLQNGRKIHCQVWEIGIPETKEDRMNKKFKLIIKIYYCTLLFNHLIKEITTPSQ